MSGGRLLTVLSVVPTGSHRYPLDRFINVDLDVESKGDLAPLVEALDRVAHCLGVTRYRGRNMATFELNRDPASPDSAIRRFAEAVLKLPDPARRAWKEALVRELDIGIQATNERQLVALSVEAVRLASKIDAEILATVYPYDPDDPIYD